MHPSHAHPAGQTAACTVPGEAQEHNVGFAAETAVCRASNGEQMKQFAKDQYC